MTKKKPLQEQRFRTQFNPDYKGTPGEVNNEESKTIPDENMSVKQMLINHARGLGTGVAEVKGFYTGDQIAPKDVDLTDGQERVKSLREQARDAGKAIKEDQKKAEEERVKKAKQKIEAEKEAKKQEEAAEPAS